MSDLPSASEAAQRMQDALLGAVAAEAAKAQDAKGNRGAALESKINNNRAQGKAPENYYAGVAIGRASPEQVKAAYGTLDNLLRAGYSADAIESNIKGKLSKSKESEPVVDDNGRLSCPGAARLRADNKCR